jgi:hypothetical protein
MRKMAGKELPLENEVFVSRARVAKLPPETTCA